jgi:hypothetical protein
MLRKILEQPSIGRDSASEQEGAGRPGILKTGIHMPELRDNASSHSSQPTGLAFHDRIRGAGLAAQALMLARYPDYIREQVTELLRVLAAKPGEAENGIR